MFVIGERINGMFKDVRRGIQKQDAEIIQKLARDQEAAGANALDVNVGPAAEDAVTAMQWLVETIQQVSELPLALDSTKPTAIEAGLKLCKQPAIINSTTGQAEKLETMLPLAAQYQSSVIGLTMDEKGIPRDAAGRTEVAFRIVAAAAEHGIEADRLYIDPVILPVNVPDAQIVPGHVLTTMRECKLLSDPPPKTVLGLSNVSQGTALRELINRTYLVMALGAGLDAAICDPLDTELMDAMITAEMLLNKAIYCDDFLKAYRSSRRRPSS